MNIAARHSRTERAKPSASPAGKRTECAAGSLNLSIFLTSKVSIFAYSLIIIKSSGLPIVCHRTDRPTVEGGTAIQARRGKVHHSVPIPGLTHLEAIAIQVTMAGKPVKFIAAYLSPSRTLIGAHLSACFGVGNPSLDGRRPRR